MWFRLGELEWTILVVRNAYYIVTTWLHTYTIIPLILGSVQSTYTNTENTCMSIHVFPVIYRCIAYNCSLPSVWFLAGSQILLWILSHSQQNIHEHLLLSTVYNIKPLNNLLFPHKEVSEHAVYLVLFNCPLPSWIIHNLLRVLFHKLLWKTKFRWQEVKENSLYKSPLSEFTWEIVNSMLTA